MNHEDAELDDWLAPTQRQIDEERIREQYESDMEAQREKDNREPEQVTEEIETHTGCAYQGREFGARYLDSVCIEGYLWNADSGYRVEGGWAYTSGGDIPCPSCNFKQAVSQLADLLRVNSQSGCHQKWFINEARRRLRRHLEACR